MPWESACGEDVHAVTRLHQVWMRLLRRFPQVSLWLVAFPRQALPRLHHAAAAAGVGSNRIIMSSMAGEEDFLDMSTAVDLFVDTPLCGAHTTASYALWSGTPIITLALRKLVSRVGVSLALAASTPPPQPPPPALAHPPPEPAPAVAGVTGISRDFSDYEDLAAAALSRLSAHGGALKFEEWRQAELAARTARPCGLFDSLCWAWRLDRALALVAAVASARLPEDTWEQMHVVVTGKV